MVEKIGVIKNPLTIIAIFACIAEVSGTIVLPFIHADNQRLFIHFLMIFPALLVVCFFITLWCKNKVLYAPSDFKNEENYIRIHRYDVSRAKNVSVDVPTNLTPIYEEIGKLNDKVMLKYDRPFESETICKSYVDKDAYTYMVTKFNDYNEFLRIMERKGYNIEPYGSAVDDIGNSPGLNKAIWLGSEIPFEIAMEVITESKKYFPFLDYIHISGDLNENPPKSTHKTIYIGGATSTAKEFGLHRIPADEFRKIYQFTDIEQLHDFIRSYYP